MTAFLLIASALVGYLLGAIPTGYLWVKLLTGRDVRQVGSGRTGGTNAMRAGGSSAFVLTGVGDFAKGFVGVVLARGLAHAVSPGDVLTTQWAQVLAGGAAVLGHNWSVYIGFKGGAGTSPNLGAAAALSPLGWLLIPIIPVLLVATGYASVASLVAASLVPLVFLVLALARFAPWPYVAYGLITLALVVWALRPNIVRLIAGTERMVGPRAKVRDQSSGVRAQGAGTKNQESGTGDPGSGITDQR